jgi:hypothetical protein
MLLSNIDCGAHQVRVSVDISDLVDYFRLTMIHEWF